MSNSKFEDITFYAKMLVGYSVKVVGFVYLKLDGLKLKFCEVLMPNLQVWENL
jgi:hypothetical protein